MRGCKYLSVAGLTAALLIRWTARPKLVLATLAIHGAVTVELRASRA